MPDTDGGQKTGEFPGTGTRTKLQVFVSRVLVLGSESGSFAKSSRVLSHWDISLVHLHLLMLSVMLCSGPLLSYTLKTTTGDQDTQSW